MPSAVNGAPLGVSFSDLPSRELPSNFEAEKSVLSACLVKPEIADDVCVILEAGNFKHTLNRNIFEAIFEIVKDGGKPDLITVTDKLQATGRLSQAGDATYLADLVKNSFAIVNWRHHAEIVKRVAIQRDLITAAAEINAIAYDGPDSISEVVGQAESALFKVTEKRVSNSFRSMEELCVSTKEDLEKLAKHKGEILGVPSGFRDIDKLFCGFRPGDVIVLAARPGVGKTSFALNMAVKSAKLGTSVAFFSLEMSAEQLTQRILSSEAGVELSKIRSGMLGAADWSQINPTLQELGHLDMLIDDTPGLSILEARAKVRRQFRHIIGTDKKGLVIVDYLQLMTPPVARRDGNRSVEVGEITRGLKVLAKDLGVPILALSQLNRSVETRGTKSKRPMLSDLRESGTIEQDADIVLFIDRSMNEEEAESSERPDMGEAVIQVAKHRNGPQKDIWLSFNGEFTRFGDLDQDASHNYEN